MGRGMWGAAAAGQEGGTQIGRIKTRSRAAGTARAQTLGAHSGLLAREAGV